MARHFTLALGAAALRVSDVYGDGAGVVNAAHDLPYRQLLVSASGAKAYLGESTVSTTDYGVLLDNMSLEPVALGPFETGPVKLSGLYAVGAGATLHVLAIPF